MIVHIVYDTLGADLGPNFTLTANSGTCSPSAVTRTDLLNGIDVSVDSSITGITVTSIGSCTNTNLIAVGTYANYGLLYNYYALSDSRNLAPTGWHVMTRSEYFYFMEYITGNTITNDITSLNDNRLTYGLRITGTTFWSNSSGTNDYKFSLKGAGYREGPTNLGIFMNIQQKSQFITPTLNFDSTQCAGFYIQYDVNTIRFQTKTGYGYQFDFKSGGSAALVKDSTSLTNGQTGTCVGNDGKRYTSICLGTTEYVFHIAETKYRNMDTVSYHGAGADFYTNTEWYSLTTEACCPPNGNWNNV